MLLELTSITANVCVIAISIFMVVKYLKIKKCINKYMEIDKLIDNIEELEIIPDEIGSCDKQRERLIAVTASGNAKLYLGKIITTSEIEKLEEKEVLKLYSRYETYIGNVMTKSLKSTICSAYTAIISALIPSISKGKYMLVEGERLSESLIENPVINLALSTYNCKLYHDYGHYLAPLTAGLLTSGHIKSL